MPLKDPTEWMEDITVYIDDQELIDTAAAMEPMLVYGGSIAAAGAWVALVGTLAGTLGGVTLSPAVRRSWLVFAAYLVGAAVLLRFLYPLSKRLLGPAVAWCAGLSMFWAFLLGIVAVWGARLDSPFWGYVLSGGGGAFLGMMSGSLNPGVVRREDAWMGVALPLAPLTCVLATYVARAVSPDTDAAAAALAGAIAGGVFSVVMGMLLARLWDEAYGLSRMGLLYLHNDHFAPKAIAYLDRAIALAPEEAEFHNLRGIAWSKMNEPDRAEADWRKVSELTPQDPEPHLNRGVDFLRRGDLAQAVEALLQALTIDPDHAKAHSTLGAAYERQGDFDQAIAHYSQAITRVPDYANAYSNRGHAYFRTGDHERALEDCEHALELDPELAMAAVNRGHVLAALGRTDDATDSYQAALDLEPEPAIREDALKGLEALEGQRRNAERA